MNRRFEVGVEDEWVFVPSSRARLQESRHALALQSFNQMNSGAETGTDLVMPAIVEPEMATDTEPLGDPEGDWLCAWCHNRVANERDRFSYDGKEEFAFSNPEGVRFEIITFSQTLGCEETGTPTLEHTWFPGHAWSFCQCDNCGTHLGWYYSGEHEFAGLIKNRIVRALYLRN